MSLARSIIEFVETLRLSSGSYVGQPFKLRSWQKDMIRQVYDDQRTVRTALLSIGRKNGKTEFTAALALAHACLKELTQANQQIIIAANDRDQAVLMYKTIASFIRQDTELAALFNIVDSRRRMSYRNGSEIRVVPAVAASLHGLNPSVIFCDEAGNWEPQEKAREIYGVLSSAFGAQARPLMWLLSTQSTSETHFFSELVRYGEKVKSGDIEDPSFAPFVYQIPQDADVFDESNWHLANPALGDFRSLEDMRNVAEKAKAIPSQERQFRQLFCNQQVNASETFISPSLWKANNGLPTFNPGDRIHLGLDLALRNDLSALVAAAPREDGSFDVKAWFWKPADLLLEHKHRDHAPFDVWRDAGLITATPGSTIDYSYIAQKIAELMQEYRVEDIAYDSWKIADLERALDEVGVHPNMTPVIQGFKTFGPLIDDLEEALLQERIRHGGNPVLSWCASNAIIISDASHNRKFEKAKSYGRIDGLVALGQAIRSCLMEPETEPGLIFI